MKTWIEPEAVSVPAALRKIVGGHALVAETLARRGLTTVAAARSFLDPTAYTPASPFDLPDMERAVERVRRAIEADEMICVWGDFDVDGQTSTALLVEALRDLGAKVSYHIPHRERDGHGLHVPALERIIGAGAGLILTCDTGIAAHAAVEYAHGRGADVIITDHHNLPESLPAAHATVNPKRLPDGHALRELPGVGVAYKLAEALYAGRDTTHFLDLAALGIVADVAVQTGDTRYLLQSGLAVLRNTERPGLQAMMELARLKPEEISEQHIGFVLGPRLNALGRLADANPAVELLTSDDREQVRILATQLEGLNAERKFLAQQVYDGAQSQIDTDATLLEHAALVLAHPHWPGGVIGPVASRLVEQYNRPAILITTPPGEVARGSARSVAGCDITAAIAAQADLLQGFGGHTMAAGMSLDAANIPEFRRRLARSVESMLGGIERAPQLAIDAYMPLGDLSLDLVRDVERLAPFGPGNPPLVLATATLRIRGRRTLGRRGEHLQLTVADEADQTQRVIWWQGDADALPAGSFDLAYTVRASDYKGRAEVLVEWLDARPRADDPLNISDAAAINYQDFRNIANPLDVLRQLHDEAVKALIWREADNTLPGANRGELDEAPVLAVWTIPPGPNEWQAALERVAPQIVYLFGGDPDLDTLAAFAKRLAGLVKYALNQKGGVVALDDLAAAMAHREETIRAGLEWLAARGDILIGADSECSVTLAPGAGGESPELALATARIEALLRETAAYRKYWRGMRVV